MKSIRVKNIICAITLFVTVLSAWGVYAQDNAATGTKRTFSQEELAQMLAPIALYPDPLLSQILMAATYPFEVAEAERWITKNPYLKDAELDEALQGKDWDVSVLALCHYPEVLTMMSENLSWTASVGDAFANQEGDVTAAIQELRSRARAAGNLSTTPEQKVIVEERYIRIEPVSTTYIYIPAYDPMVVYGHWWLPMYPPYAIVFPGLVVTGGGLVFSPPFYVGYGVYGWCGFNWGLGRIVIVDINRTKRYYRHHHRHSWTGHHHWRPDHDRRHVRERRSGEIPHFVPPAQSKPQVRPGDHKPGQGGGKPDKGGVSPGKKPDAPRDQRPQWNQPDSDRRKSSGTGAPGSVGKERPAVSDRSVQQKDKPAEKPKTQDRDKVKVQDKGTAGPPVIHDRGRQESRDSGRQSPSVDRQRTTGDQKVRERDSGRTIQTQPKGGQGDPQDRSRERWNERRSR